jgi:thymidylate kinase
MHRTAQKESPQVPRESDREAIETARTVGAALERRALVLGTLPPEGRDLDLVVRLPEREAAAATLSSHGFLPRGRRMTPRRRWIDQWVRFSGSSAFSVDLNPAERWGLPAAELDALFREAGPVRGLPHIAHPAPHHVLLLAARRLARLGGRIDPKRRRRINRALSENPEAWSLARERAPLWGLERALWLLETAYHFDTPAPGRGRTHALAALLWKGGARWWTEVFARGLRSRLPRRTRVVSISGLDGAGKSTQTTGLEETLRALGVDAAIEWMPLGHAPRHRVIRLLRRSVEALLSLPGRLRGGSGAGKGGARSGKTSAAKSLRQRSELVTQAWATVVALHQAIQHRLAVLRHMGSGKIVIFDRYTLDASAQLRYFYGSRHDFRFQKWLVRRISPKPARSYLLVVPPEVVHARKDDMQYTLAELHEQAGLLAEEADRVSIPKLDGTRPLDDLREQIAREVWSSAG